MIGNIKFGIKISTHNFDLLPNIYSNLDIINFIEIILPPNFTVNDLIKIKNIKIPYIIHLAHSSYDIDFGDINRNNSNNKYINKINMNLFKYRLSPICFIIHPESGDIDLSIKNIKKLKIKLIAIENMPIKPILGKALLGYDPNSLKPYFDQISDLELCFDVVHTIKAAITKNIDYIKFIKDFLKFKNPIVFHISGTNLDTESDKHLPLNESQYDLLEIKKILLNHRSIVNLTFETPRNYKNRIKDDLKNMNYFLNT